MLISLISDPHIAPSPEDSFGVDTQTNFARVIARLRELGPDHVVLMGDYSLREPRAQDVEWVASRAQLADAPVCAIVGNHDDALQVAHAFKCGPSLVGNQLYYRQDLGNDRALFLDTAAGYLDTEQVDWLRLEVRAAKRRVLVFMHHPPVEMGVKFMDEKYSFSDADEAVYNALFAGPVPVHVFCGHYHTARTTQIGIHSVDLCPSTYFQIDPGKSDFAISHTMPGIRHVELLADQVRTWIEFLPTQ